MNKAELLSDPSLIINEDGNILCVKTLNGREHHLKPEVVLNTARMSNEGWMVKRKLVPIFNGNGEEKKLDYELPDLNGQAQFSKSIILNPEENRELVEEYMQRTSDPSDTPLNNIKTGMTGEEMTPVSGNTLTTTIDPPAEYKKRKGGRPVGSKNKKTKKVKS